MSTILKLFKIRCFEKKKNSDEFCRNQCGNLFATNKTMLQNVFGGEKNFVSNNSVDCLGGGNFHQIQ